MSYIKNFKFKKTCYPSNFPGKEYFISVLMIIILISCGQNDKTNITKDEIIQNSWKAMFGELKNSDIKSIYVEGYFHGREVPNLTTIKRPNLFINDIGNSILVFDGKRAGEIKKISDLEGKARQVELLDPAHWCHFEVDMGIVFPGFFDFPSQLRGIEKFNGSEAYELYVEFPLGGNVTYFVDVESFLITRRLVSWDGDPEKNLWENLITRYNDYNGILYPEGYTYEGRDSTEIGIFKNVKFNIDQDDEYFKILQELQ